MSTFVARLSARRAHQDRIRIKPGEQAYGTRHGGTTKAKRSMGDVARIMGISRQAVHQLERNAIHKLRLALHPILLELNRELAEEVNHGA